MEYSEGRKAKKLGTRETVLLGLSFMAPALSLLATFNLVMVAGYTWVGVPLAYLFAGLTVIITAASFADLSRTHPEGGSVWAYSKNILGADLGQLSVWIYLLELLVVPAAALIPVGFFAQEWLGIPPWLTVLIAMFIVVLVANAGVNLSFRTMAILFGIQLVILLTFAISSIAWAKATGTYSFMARAALSPSGSLMGWAGIMVGAAAAVYSFLGFESSAAMANETESPTKVIPRSIVLTAIVGTVLNTFLAWAFVLAIPTKGLFSLLYYINPVPAMAGVIWQNIPPFYAAWRHVINLGGIVAGVTGALASVTAASRVLEQLGKDQIIPAAFSRTSARRQTPILAIAFVGAVGLVLAEFAPWESIAYLIATGAVPTFLIVNFLAFWQRRQLKPTVWGTVRHWLVPWLGIVLCAWIIAVGLPIRMKMTLMLWILVGIVLVFLRACINPELSPEGCTQPGARGSACPGSWVGLCVSAIVLIGGIVAFKIWHRYLGGGLTWWHAKAPYASESGLAAASALGLAILMIAVAIGRLRQERQGGETR